jgi:hypothetical protein
MATILPRMVLDIRLDHPDQSGTGPRQIVIDTKFTSVTKPNQFGSETLSSAYVYQIYAYLMSQDANEVETKSEGLMLHPVVGGNLDEEVVIPGAPHPLRHRRPRDRSEDHGSPVPQRRAGVRSFLTQLQSRRKTVDLMQPSI